MSSPTITDSDPYGLMTPEFRADPYPVYARVRAETPAYFSEAWNGWLLTRYADVAAGFRDARFSANRSASYAQKLPPAVRERLDPLLKNLASWILLIDPPEHTRIRALVNKAFTPRLIERLRPRIQGLVWELLDQAQQGPRQGVDLIAALANPLPVIVIGEMLGLPREDRHRLKGWSDSLASFIGGSRLSMDIVERALAGILEMEDYFRGVIAERRARPGEDLVSSLVAAEEQGMILGERELLATCSMILFGGHETTTNLIGNAIHALLRHPDALLPLRGSPGAIGRAVDEFLRYDSPVQRMGRIAREELTIGDQTIRAGDRLFLVMGAANRDPAVFPDPDRLDVRRKDNRHLAFGLGTHFCVGAALGRLEAEIAIGEVIRRFPGLRLAEEPRWLDNLTIRGFEALRVDLGEGSGPLADETNP